MSQGMLALSLTLIARRASKCVPHQGDHKGPRTTSSSAPALTMTTKRPWEGLGVIVRAGVVTRGGGTLEVALGRCGAAPPAITTCVRERGVCSGCHPFAQLCTSLRRLLALA